MDIILARGLRLSFELSNASTLLTRYFPLSACYTCRVNTICWKPAFPERYLRYRTASCSSLGLISHNLIYQRSLKQRVNKNGIILAHYSDLKQSSQSDYQKPQAEQKISVFQKMKQMTKDYWHVLIPVHILTSIGWAAIFYTAVRNGVDVAQILEYMNFSEKYVNLVRNSSAGDWAITYALYKIFTPLRYTVTVGGTTIAIRQLSRLGYVKAPSFKLQSAEPARKIMSRLPIKINLKYIILIFIPLAVYELHLLRE
ncbi:hypothetical protein DMN91_006952 [Ooceraea biroi]|uniref:DUF1279 domain-containing protein n=1 Tax=Ooceraea biroi TaxID=2015173 RepID=A0A3L8DIT4_OOCBI|nr:hypothetical protein DMN91_006952 [Ooceraea biroi]